MEEQPWVLTVLAQNSLVFRKENVTVILTSHFTNYAMHNLHERSVCQIDEILTS